MNFRKVEFDRLREPAAKGHSAILHVACAYSALESVEVVFEIGRNKSIFTPIETTEIAKDLTSKFMNDPVHHLGATVTAEKLAEGIRGFLANESNYFSPIVQAMRNATFHGHISPTKLRLHTAGRQRIFTEIAEETIRMADCAFSELHKRSVIKRLLQEINDELLASRGGIRREI